MFKNPHFPSLCFSLMTCQGSCPENDCGENGGKEFITAYKRGKKQKLEGQRPSHLAYVRRNRISQRTTKNIAPQQRFRVGERLGCFQSSTTSARTSMFSTSFLHPLLNGSHFTTRRLGALETSSTCHLRHYAPTVRHTMLYDRKSCSTTVVRPRHNGV